MTHEDLLSEVILKGSQLCEQLENMVSFTVVDKVDKNTEGSVDVVSKESPGTENPDPLTDHSVVLGRTNAQKIQAKKKTRDGEIM
jgi:hypothetical protein